MYVTGNTDLIFFIYKRERYELDIVKNFFSNVNNDFLKSFDVMLFL